MAANAAAASTREKAIAALRKNAATKDAFEIADPVPGISTGCFAVDLLSGIGGFPVGRVSEVFGWEYSGKTTLCVSACAQAQQTGTFTVFADAEQGLDRAYADKLGFVTNDDDVGLYVMPKTFEQTMDIVEKMAETGSAHLIVVDSIPAMVPEGELAELDKVQIGARARLLANVMPKITKRIKESQTALVFINQMRQKLVIGHTPAYMLRKEDTEQSAGGSALKFYSSFRLDMRIAQRGEDKVKRVDLTTGKEDNVPVSNRHEAKTIKNRHGVPYQKGSFTIRYDAEAGLYGIDNLTTYINVGLALGIVTKVTGGEHYFEVNGDRFSIRGEEAFLQRLRETPEAQQSLITQIEQAPEIAPTLARRWHA